MWWIGDCQDNQPNPHLIKRGLEDHAKTSQNSESLFQIVVYTLGNNETRRSGSTYKLSNMVNIISNIRANEGQVLKGTHNYFAYTLCHQALDHHVSEKAD